MAPICASEGWSVHRPALRSAYTPAITDRIDYRSFMSLEPTIVLATVAAATSHIGLIATASTTYNEPELVAGPLNVPRSPQGRPVTVQAGGSSDGRELAAAQAEAVFTLAQTIEEGTAYARDLRTRAAAYGRAANSIVILPGLATVIGRTEAEAKRRQDELWELVPIEYSLARLAGTLQIDPALLELDKPLPDPLPLPSNANHTMFQGTVNIARHGNLTVRQLLRARQWRWSPHHRRHARTDRRRHRSMVQGRRRRRLQPNAGHRPSGLEVFVDCVVPILQKRGLFRRDYAGTTLRSHFGLPHPPSRFAGPTRTVASA